MDLHLGQNIRITVAYRPDITADAFMATFQISEPNVPIRDISTIFYSAAAAAQRAEAECIVERPLVFLGGQWRTPPLPKFVESNGLDFGAVCIGGTDTETVLLNGLPGSGSSIVVVDMFSGRLASWIDHGQPIYYAKIVNSYIDSNGLVRWQWLHSK